MTYVGKTKPECIFRKFSEKHSRATEIFKSIYRCDDEYITYRYLKNPRAFDKIHPWTGWYYYKKAVKYLETLINANETAPGTKNDYYTDVKYLHELHLKVAKHCRKSS